MSHLVPKPDAAELRPSPSEPLRHQLLAALAQHRIATTAQLQAMLRPSASRQAISQPLIQLRGERFVGSTALPSASRSHAWYLTPNGARLTRDWPALRGRPPYPITSATAASLRTPHTLTAVRAHLAFAADARQRGDEHRYLDWTPEVAHSIGEGQRVIADAFMHYTLTEGDERTKLRAFVEIDRATTSAERLATKLIDYARLHTYIPIVPGRRAATRNPGPSWQRWYPLFPRVLFILTGASPRTLNNRIADLNAMTREHPAVTAMARDVPLAAALLEDLEQHGPTTAVWTPLAAPAEPRSWTDL
ncbi:replication-relaxation family protein [Streptomyces sp. NPDC020681]|uniref:replication-relaxation family protein n=1 Tax=Streptomyces sp. NPDC020681 TaxID=3365083 RepID=UPI0037B3ED89